MGLTNEEVIASRRKNGTNKIEGRKENSLIKLFIESLGDPIIKILLIALGIKIIFLFKDFDWYETVGIVIAILIASLVSSISEYGSEKAFERLQSESLNLKVKVKRNNQIMEINSDDIVVGDIIILSSGDKIPADGILIRGNITVDESSLTGETKEINKMINNKLYRGTIVYSNEGIMEVTNVGENTVYGKLALELKVKEPESPLKIKLRDLAKKISKIGYIGAILISLSYLFSVIVINNNFDINLIIETITNYKLMLSFLLYALTLSVTIIVVAVPEGLPMMITLVLSTNMKKMIKDNVLVRKLVGIETSGCINVLLTDKTGTLTKGKLEVISFYDGDLKEYSSLSSIKSNKRLYDLLDKSLYYNNESIFDINKKVISGNSTDRALLQFIGYKERPDKKIIDIVLFNSNNKYSKLELEDTILIKGAIEKILPICSLYYDSQNKIKELKNKSYINNLVSSYTKKGIRVLAIAYKDKERVYDKGYIFLGVVLIKDDIRKETKSAIKVVKNAGIDIKMITGDAKETAIAIGKEINLLQDSDLVLTSDEFNKMNDLELKKIFHKIKIIARALPSDKSRLVNIAKELDLVVGMTGDGINDAPALKKADVGFAMGSGVEVAKDASDIVILDDNFLSISKAILYGRTTFKSIRRFIIFQLTVNMCALVMSLVGPFIGIDVPITIVQMLWLNMIMDTFAGIAFSKEPPLKEYMEELPKAKNEFIINKYMYSEIIVMGLYSALLCILFLKVPFISNLIRYENKYFLTAFFALFIFIDIFNAFNARTERLNILANILKNKLFIIIILLIIVAQIYLIYYGGSIFRTYGLTIKELLIIIGISFTVIPVDFIRKKILKRKWLTLKI